MLEVAADALIMAGVEPSLFGPAPVLQPITALAPLHLVDHNFNDVLKGSRKLQRAMFSQPGFLTREVQVDRLRTKSGLTGEALDDALDELPYPPLIPLEWLERKLSLDGNFLDLGPWKYLHIDTRTTARSSYRTKLKNLVSSKFGNENASWRRLQVVQSDVSAERIQAVLVTFIPLKHGFERRGMYTEKLDFKDGTTLGEVFERVMEITCRTKVQHVAAAVAADKFSLSSGLRG